MFQTQRGRDSVRQYMLYVCGTDISEFLPARTWQVIRPPAMTAGLKPSCQMEELCGWHGRTTVWSAWGTCSWLSDASRKSQKSPLSLSLFLSLVVVFKNISLCILLETMPRVENDNLWWCGHAGRASVLLTQDVFSLYTTSSLSIRICADTYQSRRARAYAIQKTTTSGGVTQVGSLKRQRCF